MKGGGKKEDRLHQDQKRGSDPQLKKKRLVLRLKEIFNRYDEMQTRSPQESLKPHENILNSFKGKSFKNN